jgi:hypothetical protein
LILSRKQLILSKKQTKLLKFFICLSLVVYVLLLILFLWDVVKVLNMSLILSFLFFNLGIMFFLRNNFNLKFAVPGLLITIISTAGTLGFKREYLVISNIFCSLASVFLGILLAYVILHTIIKSYN